MSQMIKSIRKLIAFFLIGAAAGASTWYFLSHRIPLASDQQIAEEFASGMLNDKERALADSLYRFLASGSKSRFDSLVIDNAYALRFVFHKLLQEEVYWRFAGEPDSSLSRMNLAREMAEVYARQMDDGFLRHEVEFIDNLPDDELRTKLTADLLFKEAEKIQTQNSDEALSRFESSLRLSKRINDLKAQADILVKTQYLWYTRGDYNRALRLSREALTLSQQINYRFREQWARNSIGSDYLELSRYREALEHLEAGLRVAEALQDDYCQMRLYWRQGYAYSRLGRYHEAIAVYNKATQFESFKRSSVIQINLYNDRSIDYRNLGDYERAEQDLLTALQIVESDSLGATRDALAAHNLGEFYRVIGAYDKALPYLKRSYALYEELDSPFYSATVLTIIGHTFRDQGDNAAAIDYYNKALKRIEDQGQRSDGGRSRLRYSEILLSIGDIYNRTNKLPEAWKSYDEALSIFQEQEFLEGTVEALTRLGDLHRKNGELELSLEKHKQAIRHSKSMQSPLLHARALYSIGLTYEEQRNLQGAEKAYVQAIQFVEKHRTRIRGDDRITYFALLQDFYDQLILLLTRESKNDAAFAYSERARGRAFLDLLDQSANGKNHGTTPQTWETIQASLDSNIQVIQYKVTHEKLIIFVGNKDSLFVASHPTSREHLQHLIREYRQAIGADGDTRFISRLATDPGAVYDSSISKARSLSQVLIEPIRARLDDEKIMYVIADEALNYLPFASLVIEENGQPAFLIEHHALAYAPSASILKYLIDNRRPGILTNQLTFFGLGNPTGDLPYAASEVSEVAKMFAVVDTLIGNRIDEQTVVKQLSQEMQVLHLATHAVINEQNSAYSFLAVGDGDMTSSNGTAITFDGKLHAAEISTLDLAAVRLVTLSACESQKGTLFRGEGVTGFSRAFISAGASSILTTLWQVDDKRTKELIIDFYRTLTSSNIDLPRALRKAQTKLIKAVREDPVLPYPFPYAWAAFNIVGDCRL